jgi:hypothetical protein
MALKVRELERPAGVPPTVLAGSPAECSAVAGLIAMIEGNPVFGGRSVMPEEQERFYRAVVDTRRLIVETGELLPPGSAIDDLLAAMRAACRKYIDEAEAWDRKVGRRYQMPSFVFYQLLGAFRELMGVYIWRLGEICDLEIEGRLTTIFPGVAD